MFFEKEEISNERRTKTILTNLPANPFDNGFVGVMDGGIVRLAPL